MNLLLCVLVQLMMGSNSLIQLKLLALFTLLLSSGVYGTDRQKNQQADLDDPFLPDAEDIRLTVAALEQEKADLERWLERGDPLLIEACKKDWTVRLAEIIVHLAVSRGVLGISSEESNRDR